MDPNKLKPSEKRKLKRDGKKAGMSKEQLKAFEDYSKNQKSNQAFAQGEIDRSIASFKEDQEKYGIKSRKDRRKFEKAKRVLKRRSGVLNENWMRDSDFNKSLQAKELSKKSKRLSKVLGPLTKRDTDSEIPKDNIPPDTIPEDPSLDSWEKDNDDYIFNLERKGGNLSAESLTQYKDLESKYKKKYPNDWQKKILEHPEVKRFNESQKSFVPGKDSPLREGYDNMLEDKGFIGWKALYENVFEKNPEKQTEFEDAMSKIRTSTYKDLFGDNITSLKDLKKLYPNEDEYQAKRKELLNENGKRRKAWKKQNYPEFFDENNQEYRRRLKAGEDQNLITDFVDVKKGNIGRDVLASNETQYTTYLTEQPDGDKYKWRMFNTKTASEANKQLADFVYNEEVKNGTNENVAKANRDKLVENLNKAGADNTGEENVNTPGDGSTLSDKVTPSGGSNDFGTSNDFTQSAIEKTTKSKESKDKTGTSYSSTVKDEMEKLGLQDYYPQANRQIGVGSFKGEIIGSQTIYTGEGVLLPMGLYDSRKREIARKIKANQALLDKYKKVPRIDAQFQQKLNDVYFERLTPFLKKYKNNPAGLLNDTEFLKFHQDIEAAARNMNEVGATMQMLQKQLTSEDGKAAGWASKKVLSQINKWNLGAINNIDDYLTGKENAAKIKEELRVYGNMYKISDEKIKVLLEKGKLEASLNTKTGKPLTEEAIGEFEDARKRAESGYGYDSYISAVRKYYDFADLGNVARGILSEVGVDPDSKDGQELAKDLEIYLNGHIPNDAITVDFDDVNNQIEQMRANKANEKLRGYDIYKKYQYQNTVQDLSTSDFSGDAKTFNMSKKNSESYNNNIKFTDKKDKKYTLKDLQTKLKDPGSTLTLKNGTVVKHTDIWNPKFETKNDDGSVTVTPAYERRFKVIQNSVTVKKGKDEGKITQQRIFQQNFNLVEQQTRQIDQNGVITYKDVDVEVNIGASGSSYEVVNKNGVQNKNNIRGLNAVATGPGASTSPNVRSQKQ